MWYSQIHFNKNASPWVLRGWNLSTQSTSPKTTTSLFPSLSMHRFLCLSLSLWPHIDQQRRVGLRVQTSQAFCLLTISSLYHIHPTDCRAGESRESFGHFFLSVLLHLCLLTVSRENHENTWSWMPIINIPDVIKAEELALWCKF